MQIHFFGVGAAINEINNNTFFLISDGDNNLQVDCGGGKYLTKQIKFNNIKFDNLFLTHKHPDHILGFFHFINVFKKELLTKLNIYCSSDVKKTIINISNLLGGRNEKLIKSDKINFINIDKIDKNQIGDFVLNPVNLQSKKIEQYGFLLKNKSKRILFFGDEAIGVLGRNDLDNYLGVDYLIIESVCLESMATRSGGAVNTKKFSHITSKDAGKIAHLLQVKNLIIIHTMDIDKRNRQQMLISDAKKEFSGNIIVPNSGDIIKII